jgi:hypothetical protein
MFSFENERSFGTATLKAYRTANTLFLGLFWLDINSKKFKNITFRLNSTRAIDWCINCHIWMRKNFDFFLVRIPPCENRAKFFSHPDMTIYTPIDSPCRV